MTSIGRKMQTLLLSSDRKSGISHRMVPVLILYITTLTYIFKVTNCDMWISWKLWEQAKNAPYLTFLEVDISNRLGQVRMVYFISLTFIFKVKQFLAILLLQEIAWHTISPADLSCLVWPPPWIGSCFLRAPKQRTYGNLFLNCAHQLST